MMGVELRSEGPGRIHKHLIFNDRCRLTSGDLPSALIELKQGERASRMVLRMNPIDVLSEVANLIQSIPNWKLQFTQGRTLRQDDLYLDEMLIWIRQGNCVVGDAV